MNKSTPIFILWNNVFNHEDSNEGNLTHVNEFAPDLANFSFYYNPSRNVALVLFYYGSFSVVEGVVGDYTLRFIERTQKYIWMKMRHPYERIPINWKNLGAPEVKHLELSDYNLNSHINAVNISTIVLLDNLSIQEKSPTELLKSVLIYFNAVNMLYANFTSPRIQIVIKALMVPITVYGKIYDVLQPRELFENHNYSWLEPIVIFNMMITPICKHSNSKICVAHGKIHNNRLYCDEKDISKKKSSIYHIRHMDFQHGYSKAAQMFAFIVKHLPTTLY
uniref:BVpp58b protein n=1 Tax=Chelonus inanitus TaxID=49201 RepID=D7FB34_9HYME|nr:BVpp58b protein [Chelonus inanitus]